MTEQKMTVKKMDPAEFIREARQEISKITWPSRQETLRTTVAIVVMALISGLSFWGIDSVLGMIISRILGMNS